MKLIKRIIADIRGPNMSNQDAENMVNEKLIELQRDTDIVVESVREVSKDSGQMVYIVLYEDPNVKLEPKVTQ